MSRVADQNPDIVRPGITEKVQAVLGGSNANPPNTDAWLMSYLNLRTLLGSLGILFPLLLIIRSWRGDTLWQESLSAYYHTNSRDYFVGILVAIGVFLVTYYGHNRWDSGVSSVAGCAALGVAFFPVGHDVFQTSPWISTLHYVSAVILFIALTVMCRLFITSDLDKDEAQEDRRKRVRIYKVCGWIMAACVVILGLRAAIQYFGGITSISFIPDLYIVFVLESVAIIAFGVSWTVKGRSIERLLKLGKRKGIGSWFRRVAKVIFPNRSVSPEGQPAE